MLYSKNGSIPYPEKDDTDGWIEVEDKPVAPEGMEVVWWFPPGWVTRPLQPEGNWSWSQSDQQWVEIVPLSVAEIQSFSTEEFISLSTAQIQNLTTTGI